MKGNTYTVMRKWNHARWVHFDIWNHAREIGIELAVPKTQLLFEPLINCGDVLSETQMITLLMSVILFKMTDGAYMKYMKGRGKDAESKAD